MEIAADGIDALHRLKSTDPPLYLSPSPDLSQAARLASQNLFSSLKPFTPKSPFDRLLVEGFDAEQIWQQIDLQTHPLISTITRQVKKLEKNPEELANLFGGGDKQENKVVKSKAKAVEKIDYGVEDDDEDLYLDLEDFDEDEEESENEEEEDKGNDGEDGTGVEDKFLKIKELEEYLEDDEAREYGTTKKKRVKKALVEDEDDDEDDDDEFGLDDDDEEEEEEARYFT